MLKHLLLATLFGPLAVPLVGLERPSLGVVLGQFVGILIGWHCATEELRAKARRGESI